MWAALSRGIPPRDTAAHVSHKPRDVGHLPLPLVPAPFCPLPLDGGYPWNGWNDFLQQGPQTFRPGRKFEAEQPLSQVGFSNGIHPPLCALADIAARNPEQNWLARNDHRPAKVLCHDFLDLHSILI